LKGLITSLPLLLLTACGGIPVTDQTLSGESRGEPATPSDAIIEAQQLNSQGNRVEALNILREAGRKYPENINIRSLLEKMEAYWVIEKQLLQDRMLVIEVGGRIEAVPMLEKLSMGDPGNYLLKSRLLFWEQFLQMKVHELLSCAATEREVDITLARKCLQQANAIAPSEETSRQLAEINTRLEQRKQTTMVRIQANQRRKQASVARVQEKKQMRQVEMLLLEAEQDMQQGSLGSALMKLEEALMQDPENPRIRALIEQVQPTLESRFEALMELGDRLYRDEQIGPAVAVWEAALKLKPDQEQISQKIDRARKVLEKLEAIRSAQPAS